MRTSNVAFMLTGQFLKNPQKNFEVFIQIIAPFIWRKVVSGRRVTLPAKSTFVCPAAAVAPFDRVNSWPSQFRIHKDFYIPSSIQDSTIAGVQRGHFEPDSDFSSIFFHNYDELTRVGEPKCTP